MRILVVGDVHGEKNEIKDCEGVIKSITDARSYSDFDYLLFLGDQNDTHGNISLSVLNFWTTQFDYLHFDLGIKNIICLVGNHDMPGDGSPIHFMSSYRQINAVTNLQVIDNVGFLGYCQSEQEFQKQLKNKELNVLFCHQTLMGSVYENGFYAPDGFNVNDTSIGSFISGHIHKPQQYSNIYYPGAPRWRSVSDANENRNLVLIDIKKDGYEIVKTFDTSKYCKPIYCLKHSETSPVDLQSLDPSKAKYVIDIVGSNSWFNQEKVKIDKSIRVRPIIERQVEKSQIKESEGIQKSLLKFIENYQPKLFDDKRLLSSKLNEILIEKGILNGSE